MCIFTHLKQFNESRSHLCFCCRRIWKVCHLSLAKRRLLTWTRYNSNHMSLFNSRRHIKNPNPDKMYQNNCCYYTIITHNFTLNFDMLCEIHSADSKLILFIGPCFGQSTTVAHRLTQYEQCTKKLQDLLPDIRHQVITHNYELLQHLVSLCMLVGWFQQIQSAEKKEVNTRK